jgi:hypothetical protein
MSLTRSTIACIGVAVALAGCQAVPPGPATRVPIHSYCSEALAEVRTVGIMPFTGQVKPARVPEEITEAFVTQLEALGRFRVAAAREPSGRLLAPPGLTQGAALTVEGLIQARKQAGLDAVIVGRITQYQPYGSPVLGLDVQMVSCKTGEVDWSASAVFDSSRPEVLGRLKQYCRSRQPGEGASDAWRDVLASPRGYAQFVSHELVAEIVAK